jgi:hypothetical protein
LNAKSENLELVRASIKSGSKRVDDESVVNVLIKRPDGIEIYVDITTVKQNLKEFRVLKK